MRFRVEKVPHQSHAPEDSAIPLARGSPLLYFVRPKCSHERRICSIAFTKFFNNSQLENYPSQLRVIHHNEMELLRQQQ